MPFVLDSSTRITRASGSSQVFTTAAGMVTPCPVVAVPFPVAKPSTFMVSSNVVAQPPVVGSRPDWNSSFSPVSSASWRR
jgi:hypothetical protein